MGWMYIADLERRRILSKLQQKQRIAQVYSVYVTANSENPLTTGTNTIALPVNFLVASRSSKGFDALN